jgi:hypothetical protein
MIRTYQLMIMRLVLFQQHQSHDHEPGRRAALEPGRGEHKLGCAVARGKAGR